MRIKLDIPLKTSDIAAATNGEYATDKEIEYITTNSRNVETGDLFIALKGNKYDGESYVSEAYKKGAIILSAKCKGMGIFVDDTKESLLKLSAYYKSLLPHLKCTIAITGSVGKTTTKEFLKVIASSKYKTHATHENLNNEIGMPLSVLSAPKETEILILEMGMNHLGEISRMSKSIHPDLAVITNIGTAHIGNLGSRENIAKAKLEIKDGMNQGKIIVPFEEDLLIKENNTLSFSLEDSRANYRLIDIDNEKICILKDGMEFINTKFELKDKHLLICLLAAIASGCECNLNKECLTKGISSISRDNIRQRVIKAHDFYFLNDSYNASFESVLASFNALQNIKDYRRRSLVLGDILELGEHTERIHKEIGRQIFPNIFYNLFLFGNHVKYIENSAIISGFPRERIFTNYSLMHELSAKQILENSIKDEIILLKGSRLMQLEKIIELINYT